jgi:predicted ester cyclase
MDQSLQVMARYNALWTPAGLDRAESVIAPHFVRYGSSGQFSGVAALKRYILHYLNAFPDLRFAVDEWLAQGEKVMIHYSFSGTHERAFMGIAATGRRVRAEGVAIYRVGNGKLVELWDFLDLFGIAEQLGAQLRPVNPALSWK